MVAKRQPDLSEAIATGGMMLLPPAPDVCQTCAVKHEPEQPHNQQSLYYQVAFHAKYGRWPTWDDALAHVEPDIQRFWRAALRKRGVEIALEPTTKGGDPDAPGLGVGDGAP